MKPGHLGVRRLGVLTSVSATAVPSEHALEGGPLVIPGKGRTSWSPEASADTGWGSRLAHCFLGGMKTWAPSWALSQTLGGVGGQSTTAWRGRGWACSAVCLGEAGSGSARLGCPSPGPSARAAFLGARALHRQEPQAAGPHFQVRDPLGSQPPSPRAVVLSVVPEVLAALGEGEGGGHILRPPGRQRLEFNFSNDRRTQKQGQRF